MILQSEDLLKLNLFNNNNQKMARVKKFGFSFSWKRAVGISAAKQSFARRTGIPTTRSGVEKKIGSLFLNMLLRKRK